MSEKEENQALIKAEKIVDALVAKAKAAQEKYAHYTQEQVDAIFQAAAKAASAARIPLSKMAVEETGMGIVEDKVIYQNSYVEKAREKHYRAVKILDYFFRNFNIELL